MNQSLKAKVLKHPFFIGMKPEHQDIVAHNAAELTVETGDIVFREGDPATRFFLVQSGKVALETSHRGKLVEIDLVGPGEVLGWSWLFPPFAWRFQARAVEPTDLIVLDGGHLLVGAEDNNQFGYDLMRRTTQIVIQRLQKTREQLMALK